MINSLYSINKRCGEVVKRHNKSFNLIIFLMIFVFSSISMEAYFHHFFHEVFTENVEAYIRHSKHLINVGCHVEPAVNAANKSCQFDRFLFSVESSYFSLFANSLNCFQISRAEINNFFCFISNSYSNHKKSRAPPLYKS